MKVFIAGPRAISVLDAAVQVRLNNIYKSNYTVLVGDANGVDKAVQTYYSNLGFGNVIVYACEGKARNNIGSWAIQSVAVPAHIKGFDYYASKDKAMSDDADYGFMIWNGESKGTLSDIINLTKADKKTVVYLTTTKAFYNIENFENLKELVTICGEEAHALFEKLCKPSASPIFQQIALF